MELKGKHILVTGAARGLGYDIAKQLLIKGAELSIVDIDHDSISQAVDKLAQYGVVKSFTANVAQEESVQELFQTLRSQQHELHAVVNNAGILRDGLLVKKKDDDITTMSLAQWQSVIDVNLTGVFLCGRAAASWMVEKQTKGAIVNISSISRVGNVGQSNYSAAKAGVSALTVTWAKELARYGIRVADVAPGFIQTEMTASMKAEAQERARQLVPLGQWGTPEHISSAVAFILENDYFSGRTLEVDAALRI